MMIESTGQTVLIEGWIAQLKAGDMEAREELLRCASSRLTDLTSRMLRGFPQVRRFEQTEDVFQNAIMRLYKALESVELNDTRHFFRLAALQIRRELIDLARHYQGPNAIPTGQLQRNSDQSDSPNQAFEPADRTLDPRQLAEWAEFHKLIGQLPDEQREVFDLLWYHGLSQEEAATVLDVSARTVKRRWRNARLTLHRQLADSSIF